MEAEKRKNKNTKKKENQIQSSIYIIFSRVIDQKKEMSRI